MRGVSQHTILAEDQPGAFGRIRRSDGPRCPKCTTPTDVSRFQAIGKKGKLRRLY
jgi:hypothetical protein